MWGPVHDYERVLLLLYFRINDHHGAHTRSTHTHHTSHNSIFNLVSWVVLHDKLGIWQAADQDQSVRDTGCSAVLAPLTRAQILRYKKRTMNEAKKRKKEEGAKRV